MSALGKALKKGSSGGGGLPKNSSFFDDLAKLSKPGKTAMEREARSLCADRFRRQHPDWSAREIEAAVNRWWLVSLN